MRKLDQEIFDKDKKKWYKLERHWPRGLQLVEQVYLNMRKHATGGEIAYSNCEGLHILPELKPPKTPGPSTHSFVKARNEKRN